MKSDSWGKDTDDASCLQNADERKSSSYGNQL